MVMTALSFTFQDICNLGIFFNVGRIINIHSNVGLISDQ
jgi:hypothetical protein